jgi:uncharacterized protein (DUF488 family)
MINNLIYTIGHSIHTLDDFRLLLEPFHVNCIIDVRSIPASLHVPQFNQNNLDSYLKNHNIFYLPFGKEFGARRYDCFDELGNVNFEKAVHTPNFLDGVSRLKSGLDKGYQIALMCSEANPEECHRFSLLSRYFSDNGIIVKHILSDKSLKDNTELLNEMIEEYIKRKKLREVGGLFNDYNKEQQIKDAYRLKNKEIAFHVDINEDSYGTIINNRVYSKNSGAIL